MPSEAWHVTACLGSHTIPNTTTYEDSELSVVCSARQDSSTHSAGNTLSKSPLLKFHRHAEPFVAAVMSRRPR